jgi:KaiC/GvpD/RAD55 family RecA-like ATPase/DNA-binding CsgD family transcriptional regulator
MIYDANVAETTQNNKKSWGGIPDVPISLKDIEKEFEKPVTAKTDCKKSKAISGLTLIQSEHETLPFLVDGIFQQVGIGAVVGSSDTGKSSFLRQLATAVATGKTDFLGWSIMAKHQRAIYVSTEDDEQAVSILLKKQATGQRIADDLYSNLRYLFDSENLLDTLETLLSEQAADLVVVDAFSDLFSGQLNANNEVRKFLNLYSQLAQKHSCLILFLHHTGKRTENFEPSKSNVIGSQGFEAKMRLVIELRQDFLVPQYRHLCIVKGNYLPKEMKTESYVLSFNDNMVFSETGRRVAFESLVKPPSDDSSKQQYEDIKDLIAEGKSQNEAAKELNISKGQASKLMKKYGGVSNGNTLETPTETDLY